MVDGGDIHVFIRGEGKVLPLEVPSPEGPTAQKLSGATGWSMYVANNVKECRSSQYSSKPSCSRRRSHLAGVFFATGSDDPARAKGAIRC